MPTNLHYQIALITLILSGILIFYFTFNYKKMKETTQHKLSVIYNELEIEKKNSVQLKSVQKKVKRLEQKTFQKLVKIKVDILNIDFTLGEIFNNI